MSKNQGYVKIPREVLLDPYVMGHKFLLKLLAYFYARVQHKPKVVWNGRGMPIDLAPGECHIPMREMARELGISYGSLNRAIMDHRQITYWTIVKSKAGNKIRLNLGFFGSLNGSQDGEESVSRSNRVLPTEVSNRGEGDPENGAKPVFKPVQEVTAKWLEGRALSSGIQHDDLDVAEEIEKARIQAEEDGKPFTRGYMWTRWGYAVKDARRFAQKKNNGAAPVSKRGVNLYFDGENWSYVEE